MGPPPPRRVALVVHPSRPVDQALAAINDWATRHGLDVVQLRVPGAGERTVAAEAAAQPGDLVVALGGDGTVLSALRVAASTDAPVLGIACGSLGVLTATMAGDCAAALQHIESGDWTPQRLEALAIRSGGDADEWALNDFVAVRHGAGQLIASVWIDDELYVRLAGDGLIVSTALGSSGYSMAAGGPVVAAGTPGFVFTPLAMHGGNAPPLVVPASSHLRVQLAPGFAGFEIEIDGHTRESVDLDYTISLEQDKATLVSFGGPQRRLTALRTRRLVGDSPRVLARDDRALHELDASSQPK